MSGSYLPKPWYDTTKHLVEVVLPAAGTLYFTLAAIWGFPRPDDVVGTIMAIVLFLGIVLKLSRAKYEASGDKYDGLVDVIQDEDGAYLAVARSELDAAALNGKREVTYKISPTNEGPQIPVV